MIEVTWIWQLHLSSLWQPLLQSNIVSLLLFPPVSPRVWSRCTFSLERFSFERRKVIGFAITMPHDWLKKLAPHFHLIRSKTKTNRDSLARIFPRFASATCNYYEFWLAHCNVYGFCDWLKWLLWFWFYDAQLKTALSAPNTFINVLLSSLVTLCSHFLFTDNIHHLVPGLVPVRSSLNHVILLDSFAILSSRNDPFRNKRS